MFPNQHGRHLCNAIVVLTSIACSASIAPAQSPREPIVLNDDGAWCWFQDERAIITDNKLLVGSVANGSLHEARKGSVDLTVYDLVSDCITRQELHSQLEPDDHAAPALWQTPDGRILAIYSKHGSENCFYSRVTESPTNFKHWSPEKQFVPSGHSRITYSNLHFLKAENDGRGRLYNFFRGLDASFKPSFAFSDDLGASWQAGNVVIDMPLAFRHRPYVKYACNGVDTIHIVYTDGHPRDIDNSVYHIYYRDGQLHRSDGNVIGPLSAGLKSPGEGYRVFRGDAQNVAWVSDLHLSTEGHPFVVYSLQKNSGKLKSGDKHAGQDHRYRYAWCDSDGWHDHEVSYGGSRLYAGEDDYTGNICLDPNRLDTVYLSTNVDPINGLPLVSSTDGCPHYEIFRGHTGDGGQTWTFTPITHDSVLDNLRPIVPKWDATDTALLWFRGTYQTYRHYQTEVVALIVDNSH